MTHDERVLLSSEIGVLPDLDDNEVAIKARLEPGKMFLVDFEHGREGGGGGIVPDSVIKVSYRIKAEVNISI